MAVKNTCSYKKNGSLGSMQMKLEIRKLKYLRDKNKHFTSDLGKS